MTIQEYLAALRGHWILILCLVIAGGAGAYGYSKTIVPIYRSQADVMVIPTRGENPAELAQGANYVGSLVQTYTLLVRSPEVINPVIQELQLDSSAREVAASMDIEVPLDTFVIQIGVRDTDPDRARQTADAIAGQLADTVPQLSPVNDRGEPTVRVTTIAPATMPLWQISPNSRVNAVVGAGIGLILGAVVAVVRRRFLSRIAAKHDVARITDIAVLGAIPIVGEKRTLVHALRSSPNGRIAESVRQLAASLRFVDLGTRRRAIMVTSGASMEGKSSVSLGLGLTFAEAGHSVLYIEADLRRPSAATYTGLESAVGVTDVLVGDMVIADAAQQWGHKNLSVLVCGTKPPNPGQTLASGELAKLISEARNTFDYVIVDAPPVLAVSDALWLSSAVDGTLVVARVGRTRATDLRRTLDTLDGAANPVVGIVLDGVKDYERSPYYAEAQQVKPRRPAAAGPPSSRDS